MRIKFSIFLLMSENQRIIERINVAREYLGMSMRKFEKSIGISENSLGTAVRRGSDMKTEVVTLFANKYPQFNTEWIITGNGDMLKENVGEVLKEPSTFYGKPDGFEQLLINYLERDSIKEVLKEILQPRVPDLEGDFEKYLAKSDPKLLAKLKKKQREEDLKQGDS